MPEFEVEIAYTTVVSTLVTVEASTADEAQRVALEQAEEGAYDGERWDHDDGDYTATIVQAGVRRNDGALCPMCGEPHHHGATKEDTAGSAVSPQHP